MIELVIGDVTAPMLAWPPPGLANPIGAIYMHAIVNEDLYVQQILQSKPLLWETGAWHAKLGIDGSPPRWADLKRVPLDLPAFRAYTQAVFATTQDYVTQLSAEDLSGVMKFPGRAWQMSIAQLLAVVVAHTTAHAGEISALKGIQGAKGLPF
jgi:hypothetical protein